MSASEFTQSEIDEAWEAVLGQQADIIKRNKAEISALKAEVERLKSAQTWQPIDEMPKDGTWIEGRSVNLYRWLPYKQIPRNKGGATGRWQKHNGCGFENCSDDELPLECRVVSPAQAAFIKQTKT